jgi:predicted RNA-binding Zn-ribbon protein involved in translation (DUF1610 family)
LFGSSTFYKIFFTADEHIAQSAIAQNPMASNRSNIQAPVVELKINCPKCGRQHPFYAKFGSIPQQQEQQMLKRGKKFPVNNKFQCDCGFTIDLAAIRNQIESQLGRKIVD